MFLSSDFDGDHPIMFTPYRKPDTLEARVRLNNDRLNIDLFVNGGETVVAASFICLPFRKVKMNVTVSAMKNGVINFLQSDVSTFTVKRDAAYEPDVFKTMLGYYFVDKMETPVFDKHFEHGYFIITKTQQVLQELKCSSEALLWIANKGK